MNLTKYKRLLQIAESLLKKVDLPQETLAKYYEIRESILLGDLPDGPDHSTAQAPRPTSDWITSVYPPQAQPKDLLGNAIREQVITTLSASIEAILESFSLSIAHFANPNPTQPRASARSQYSNSDRDQPLLSQRNLSYNTLKNQDFLTKLGQKQNSLSEMVSELPTTELKFTSKRWIDEVESITKKFERFLLLNENLSEIFAHESNSQQELLFQLETVKDRLGDYGTEIESLEIEKEKLIDIIQDEGLTIPDLDSYPQVQSNKSLKDKLKSNEKSMKSLEKRLSQEGAFNNKLLEYFGPICRKYDDANNLDLTDRDEVLEFIGDLILKMENDNKWL
jgi:hypothetical protein